MTFLNPLNGPYDLQNIDFLTSGWSVYKNVFSLGQFFLLELGDNWCLYIFDDFILYKYSTCLSQKEGKKNQVFFLHTNFLEKIICCTLVWELDTEFLVKLKDLEGLSVQACYMCLYIELKSPNSHAESTHRDLWCLELCTFWLRVISVQYRWRFLMSRAGIHV